jgi:hypothetical protein
MANDIKVLTFIANEMMRQTKNNLQFIKNLSGQEFADEFSRSPKKGESFTVRKSTRYIGRSGETFSAEDYKERLVTITVDQTQGVDLSFSSRELAFGVDYFADRVIPPVAESLAAKLDTLYLQKAVNATAQQVGTPGTMVTTLKTYNQARALMSWQSAPNNNQSMLINPDMQVEAVDTGKAIFNPTQEIADQYETGMIGRHSGAKVYEVQNLPIHTNGQRGGTPLVNGGSQGGSVWAMTSTLVTDGWTAAAANRVKDGDVFTIAGVMAVNPWTRQSTGALQKFTVVGDVASDGSGNATITVSPALLTSGPFQNVSGAPADNAALTFDGNASAAYSLGFRFHRDAFVFGCCEQPEPTKAPEFCKTIRDPQTGLKIRYIRDWDTRNNVQIDRFDVVPAFGVAFPEFACRIASL